MGKALAELPIEPLIGRLVLLGAVLGALDPILTIAAAMGYRDPFVNPPTKRQQADEVYHISCDFVEQFSIKRLTVPLLSRFVPPWQAVAIVTTFWLPRPTTPGNTV